jgi:hypothetical protein
VEKNQHCIDRSWLQSGQHLGPIDLASEINRWLAAEVYATALITPIVDALATLMACGRAVDARSLRPYCIATR